MKGVVIIKCDGCKKNHLIADHLGWFDSQKPPGTIEDIMREKGETVERLDIAAEGEWTQAVLDRIPKEALEGLVEMVPNQNKAE